LPATVWCLLGCSGGEENTAQSAVENKPQMLLEAQTAMSDKQIDIYINSGARQCEYGGDTLETTEKVLTSSGVVVAASKCGVLTGVMFTQQCGGQTGKINIHTIAEASLAEAEKLGFKALSSLNKEKGVGFEEVACEGRGVYQNKDA